MLSPVEQFSNAIQAEGLTPPHMIEMDGKLHRFSTNGKPEDDAGWYVFYSDGIPAGAFGDWRLGIHRKWRADINRPLTQAEEKKHSARVDAIKRLRQEEQKSRKAEAREQANLIWADAVPCANHFYLDAKGIGANKTRLFGDELVIPLREGDKLHSLQFISLNGDKRFLPGGRVAGCYFSIGITDGKDALCIAEGFATGASIHEATGLPVAVAFNAGNLKAVALAIREFFPGLPLILCADDDHSTPGNPGLAKAREAAKAVNGQVAVPDFESDRPGWATDFNDMAKLRGKEAVGRAISTVVAKTRSNSQPAEKDPSTQVYKEAVELVCASEVESEPISWLWEGYLAEGKLHILGGAPGTGKTTISMALAAVVSRAERWPDGKKSPLGNIVIWSGEDNPADTLVPRLELAGADRKRIYFVDTVRKFSSKRPFDPARDIEPLKRKIAEIGDVKLLIIDSIVSAIAGDSHKNAEVRRGLQPLADLATATGCAVLGITHFSKGTVGRDPLERITGSVVFGAVARVVMVAARRQRASEEGNDARLFLRAKSNIGPDDGGFEYELKQGDLAAKRISASYVAWGAAVTGSARDLLEVADATGEARKGNVVMYAQAFLSGLLAKGLVDQTEVKALALKAGYSWATIRRAKEALKIKSKKIGGHFGGTTEQKWGWGLPTPEDAQDDQGDQDRQGENQAREDVQAQNMSTFSKSEHLQDDEDTVEVEYDTASDHQRSRKGWSQTISRCDRHPQSQG